MQIRKCLAIIAILVVAVLLVPSMAMPESEADSQQEVSIRIGTFLDLDLENIVLDMGTQPGASDVRYSIAESRVMSNIDGVSERIITATMSESTDSIWVTIEKGTGYNSTYTKVEEGKAYLWLSDYKKTADGTLTHTDRNGIISTITYVDNPEQDGVTITGIKSGSPTHIAFSDYIVLDDESIHITVVNEGSDFNPSRPNRAWFAINQIESIALVNVEAGGMICANQTLGTYSDSGFEDTIKNAIIWNSSIGKNFARYSSLNCMEVLDANLAGGVGSVVQSTEFTIYVGGELLGSKVDLHTGNENAKIQNLAIVVIEDDVDFRNVLNNVSRSYLDDCDLIFNSDVESIYSYDSSGQSVFSDISSVTILSKGCSIGDYSFSDSYGSVSMNFDGILNDVGKQGLTNVEFGNGSIVVEGNIGEGSFSESNVQNITIRGGTSISSKAFSGCTDLQSVTLSSDELVTIAADAFDRTGNSGVILYIDDSIKDKLGQDWITPIFSIQQNVFGKDAILTVALPYGDGTDATLVSVQKVPEDYIICSITVDEKKYTITEISAGAFRNLHGIESVTVPATVEKVGDYAFAGCSIETLRVESGSSAEWGTGVFDGCRGLTTVTGIKSVGDYMFNGCVSLSHFGETSELNEQSGVVNLQGVTSIGESAFSRCTSVERIENSGSVTSLGRNAFSGCSSLTEGFFAVSQNVPEGAYQMTGLTSVNVSGMDVYGSAFRGCVSLGSITVDASTTFGAGAFADCESLSTITGSITGLSNSLFSGCSSLTTLPTVTAKTIPASAFESTAITAVDLSGYTEIGTGAFQGCTSLTSVTNCPLDGFSDSVFRGCTSLTSIGFSDVKGWSGVKSIGSYALAGTQVDMKDEDLSLESVGNHALEGITLKTLTLGSESKDIAIKNGAFANTNIGTLNLYGHSYERTTSTTDFVEAFSNASIGTVNVHTDSIEDFLFSGSKVVNVELTKQTAIGSSAFQNSTSLEDIDFSNVSSIGGDAFNGCASLGKNWNVPLDLSGFDSVVGFQNCTSLKSIKLKDGCSVGTNAFNGCTSLSSIENASKIRTLGTSAFQGCTSLTSLDLTGAESISTSAFQGCTGLTSVTVSDTCDLSPTAFDDVTIVTGLHPISVGTGPDGTTINVFCLGDGTNGWRLIYGAEGIETLTITEGMNITTIGREAFRYSDTLKSVVLSPNVAQIQDYAFGDCANLESVVMNVRNGTESSDLTAIGSSAFANCGKLVTIGIPGTDNVLPKSISSIGTSGNAFANCTSLETIVLPDGIGKIPSTTFRGCTSLTEVTIPDSVTSIDSRAFLNSGLTSVTIPDGVMIGEQAFMGCDRLETVIFAGPSDVTLAKEAFRGCTSLTTIEGSEYITSIKDGVFTGAGLTEIEFSKHVQVGRTAFNNCAELSYVRFGGGADVGIQAFTNCEKLADVVFAGPSTIDREAFANCITLGYSEGEEGTENHVLDLTGVTSIGSAAFLDCAVLSSITLPNTLTSLAVDAFRGCTSVETLTATEGGAYTSADNVVYTSGGREVAMFLPSATSVVIGGSVDSIAGFDDSSGRYVSGETTALSILPNLETITVEEGNIRFAEGSGILRLHDGTIVSVPCNISSDGSLEVSGFTAIAQYAFNGVNVVDLVLDGPCDVMPKAFVNCDALVSITVSAGDEEKVYFDLSSLYSDSESWAVESLYIGAGTVVLTGSTASVRNATVNAKNRLTVPSNAFSEGNKLVSVTLYSEDMSLGDKTISNASKLESVVVAAGSIDAGRILSGCNTAVKIYLDCDSLTPDCLDGSIYSELYISPGMVDTWDDKINEEETFKGYIHYDPESGVLGTVSGSTDIFVQTDLAGVEVTLNNGKNGFTVATEDHHAPSDLVVKVNGTEVTATGGTYNLTSAGQQMTIIAVEERVDLGEWYTVSFDTGCSLVVSPVKVSSGHTLLKSMIPIPQRAGFTFEGWYTDSDLETEYKGNDIHDSQWAINSNTVLYAKWTSLGNYLDVDDSAGTFYIVDSDGGLSVFDASKFNQGGMSSGATLTFVPRIGYSLTDIRVDGTADVTVSDGTVTVSGISGYVCIVPEVKYVSHATDLEYVVEQDTPRPAEDLILAWDYDGGKVVQTGMTWSGMPSVPLIVDDCVYVQVNDSIVCLDSRTGDVLNQVDTGASSTDFYHYLGYGGGYILDYTSMKVYTEGLEEVCKIPAGIKYAIWYDGYFYGITGNFGGATAGSAVRMSPESVGADGCMSMEKVSSSYVNPMQHLYGTTSAPLIVDEDGSAVMYYISTNGSSIYINALSLKDGSYGYKHLEGLTGFYLDDGWLTYYEGHIYMTAYTVGLFGTSDASGNAVIAYFDAASPGEISGVDVETVDLGHNSLTSAFVIQNGRGYVNITVGGQSSKGFFQAYNIGEDGKPELASEIASRASHGSIVASTYNYDPVAKSGEVYIYLLNYSSSQYLTIFTDVCENGSWTLSDVSSSKPLEPGFGSQAVRVGTDGQLIFYNDSGKIYCYGSPSFTSEFGFVVDQEDTAEVKSGNGVADDAFEAFEDAVADAFSSRSASYDATAGTVTVSGETYNVFYFDDTEGASTIRSAAGLDESAFGKIRSFFLTAQAEQDIDLDKKWYGTPGNDEGTGSSGGLSISDTTIDMRTENVEGSDLPYQYQLAVTGAGDATVKWASSNTDVAIVDASGFVTARSVGQAVVTATVVTDGRSSTVSCVVYVTETSTLDMIGNPGFFGEPVSSVQRFEVVFDWGVDGVDDEVTYGTVGQIIMTPSAGTEDEGPESTSDTVTKEGYRFGGWSFNGKTYEGGSEFVITGSGTVNAIWLKEGVAVVDVTVSVGGTEVTDSSRIELTVGGAAVVDTVLVPEGSGHVEIVSSNDRIVSYDGGSLRAKAPGEVTVTITVTSASAQDPIVMEFTVVVSAPAIDVSADKTTMYVGESGQIKVVIGGEDVTSASTFETDDASILTVDQTGKYTAVSKGTATIRVAYNGSEAELRISVNGVGSITISGYSQNMSVGDTSRLTATTNPAGVGVTWSSSNPTVVSVDSSGYIHAVSEGFAIITATANDGSGTSGTCTIMVSAVKAESVEINRSSLTLTVGGTQTLKATVEPDDAANKTVVWSYSNPQVASVSSAGVVTAIAPGTAVITVTTVDGSLTDSCTVTVQGEVSSIVLDRTVVSLKVSETSKLGATTAPQEGAKITWKSSDTKVVSVSADGTIRGVSPGTATITATCGDVSATCTVTVYGESEVVDKGTVDNPDGTKTNTTEETIDAGDSTVVKTTETTTDADGNVQGTEISITATTDGSRTETNVTVITDSAGNSTAESTTTVPATVTTSNGRQTITVSLTDVTAAAEQISSIAAATGQDVIPTVVIDIGSSQQETVSSTLTITEGAMSAIAANPGTQVRVDTGVGSIQMSGEVVSEMAGMGGDVRVSVTQVFESDLTDVQTSAVAGASVFSLTATAGSEQIHQLGGTATVRLPHSLDGGKAEDVRVYYMDDAGQLVEHACKYDEESGTVEFKTTHFSYFVVSNGSLIDGGSGASSDDDDGIQTLLTVTVGLLAVLIAMMGVGMYLAFVRGRP